MVFSYFPIFPFPNLWSLTYQVRSHKAPHTASLSCVTCAGVMEFKPVSDQEDEGWWDECPGPGHEMGQHRRQPRTGATQHQLPIAVGTCEHRLRG